MYCPVGHVANSNDDAATMKAVAVTCVKNEIDIIEAFVRHTLALVDQLVVLDNGSRDGTCDVLRALEKEGLPLEVVEDPSPGKYLSQRMTRLMRSGRSAATVPTGCLRLDGDEFLAIPQGAALLPAEVGDNQPVSLRWRTYVPDDGDDLLEPNPVLRIRRRRVANVWESAKVMVPRSLASLPDVALTQGSHRASSLVAGIASRSLTAAGIWPTFLCAARYNMRQKSPSTPSNTKSWRTAIGSGPFITRSRSLC